jgi:UDP-glucose 4-epimerase
VTSGRKKILLTGGTGLLGASVLQRIAETYEVHAIVRAAPMHPRIDVHYHQIDLSTQWSANDLPPEIDAVIHLAQSKHLKEFPGCASEIFAVNTQSTATLLDYAVRAGATQFILASTGGLYGSHSGAISEAAPIAPPNGPLKYYFATKQAAELLADAYVGNLTILTLRPFFIYGPGQRASMLIPRIIDCVRRGRPVVLQGDDGITLNPVHVEDAAAAVVAGLNAGDSRTVNIAGPTVLTLREMAEWIGTAIGTAPVYTIEHKHPDRIVADITEMQRSLVVPGIGFFAGISSMLRVDGNKI